MIITASCMLPMLDVIKNMGYLYLIISAVFKTLRINLKNALPPLSTFGTLI